MAINIDISKPFSIGETIEKLPVLPQFFLTKVFNNTQFHLEDVIVYNVLESSDGLAYFAEEQETARPVSKSIRYVKSVKIPTTKEKKVFTAKEINEFKTLEEMVRGADSRNLQMQLIERELSLLKNRVYKLREKMAAELLQDGTITVSQDNGSFTIDFGFVSSATNGHKHTLTTKWDASGANPGADVNKYARIIAKRTGITPTIAVFGSQAFDAFISNAEVLKEYNNLNYAVGKTDLTQEWKSSVRYAGRYKGIDLYEYIGTYKKADGTVTDIFDAKKVVLIALDELNFVLHRAAVNTLDGKRADDVYLSVYKDTRNETLEWIAIQKSLPVLHNPDLVYSLTVL